MPTPASFESTGAADEIELGAFNAAFYELGLRWCWDENTYRSLRTVATPRQRVQTYLESEQAHLLRAYDVDFLTDAILGAHERCKRTLAGGGARDAARFNWAETRWGEVGV